jgi:23S rRNA (uracil1939-C5)-methyltransferase
MRVDLSVEKPAAGGRMIARHEGQVVLVAGAIPGERVTAVVERVEKRVAFAAVAHVIDASPDRREPGADPACGGCGYAHIAYERQRALKAAIIADAFLRIGRLPLDDATDVEASPERGYRMRARLHVDGTAVGFYREGTHTLCDAAATGQLHPDAVPAVARLARTLGRDGRRILSVEVSDTIAADQRAAHAEIVGEPPSVETLSSVLGPDLTSVSVVTDRRDRIAAGPDRLVEPLGGLSGGRSSGTLSRRAEAFFQGNRFVLPALVTTVMDAVLPSGGILDLYAGVGLFALSLAGAGRSEITAVEGEAAAGADLRDNAVRADGLTAVLGSVERYLARAAELPPTVIVDPPRTGLGATVARALAAARPARLVYVSCDPPTLARDARVLVDGGLALRSIHGFDLFPNTPHVEALALFERA